MPDRRLSQEDSPKPALYITLAKNSSDALHLSLCVNDYYCNLLQDDGTLLYLK